MFAHNPAIQKPEDSTDIRMVDIVPTNGITPDNVDTKIHGQIEVSAALPFIQVEDEFIDRTSFLTYDPNDVGPELIKETITDKKYLAEVGEERFIYMGMVRSPQTANAMRFYYDNKYNDIIVIPDINFISRNAAPGLYPLSGYAIGKLCTNGEIIYVDDSIPTSSVNNIKLPKANDETALLAKKAAPKLDSCFITGVNKSLWYKSLEIARTLNDGTQLNTTQVDFINIITLGTVEEVFGTTDTKIPHHILYQYSPLTHRIKPQGNTKFTGKLHIAIRL